VSVDTDGDGLLDALEMQIGSDPEDTDTDDDGLLDGEEVELGTSPIDRDSDADGYTDRDELHESTDPLDPSSVIYQGGWPYSFGKTELKGGLTYEVGKRFADLRLEDQFGDIVSLWDFYNEDKYVIVDICAMWCPPCVNLSRWIAGERGAQYDAWISVAEAIDSGDAYWFSVLASNRVMEPPTGEDAATWAAEKPHDLIPILADENLDATTFVELSSFPSLVLLSPDLKVHTDGVDDYTAVLDAAVEILSAPSAP
jgi:hypothetical protein